MPHRAAYVDDTTDLNALGMNEGVIVSAIVNQKSSRSRIGLLVLVPAIMAALIAPIEVPATMSKVIPCLASDL
jgi:hypothetical protein